MISYRNLNLHTLNTPEYSHVKLLFYWPIYGLAFLTLERLLPGMEYHAVWCPLDDYIPFFEGFFLPYEFWFVFLIGMALYGLMFDTTAFRRYMWFIIITYSATCVIYLIYPTEQLLRPESFARDNFLTRCVAGLYAFDTNTNVCPSIHVLGSVAVLFGAWRSKHFYTRGWRAAFVIMTVLISISTVFLKQHSIIDVIVAVAMCIPVWILLDRRDWGRAKP